MAIQIDDTKCTGCGACVAICPVAVLYLKNGKAVVSDQCMECRACAAECPVNAIRFVEEPDTLRP